MWTGFTGSPLCPVLRGGNGLWLEPGAAAKTLDAEMTPSAGARTRCQLCAFLVMTAGHRGAERSCFEGRFKGQLTGEEVLVWKLHFGQMSFRPFQ